MFKVCGFDSLLLNHIGSIIVSMLASSAVDLRFKTWSGQTKDYKMGICCLFAKHPVLRRKNKDWVARNQDNVSECRDQSIRRLYF